MKIGMVGAGRLGGNLTRRLLKGGREGQDFGCSRAAAGRLVDEGARAAKSIPDLMAGPGRPAAGWVMVPAGEPTEDTAGGSEEAICRGGAAPVMATSLHRRSLFPGDESFPPKVMAALRHEFGGQAVTAA